MGLTYHGFRVCTFFAEVIDAGEEGESCRRGLGAAARDDRHDEGEEDEEEGEGEGGKEEGTKGCHLLLRQERDGAGWVGRKGWGSVCILWFVYVCV